MSIKHGQILHVGRNFVIDRIQTGGVTNLNIPKEKVYEVGNPKQIDTVYDIPDLSFDIESFDVTTDIEAQLLGVDPSTIVAGPSGTQIDFANSIPMDIISPFRASLTSTAIVKGIGIPYLYLESAAYKFGVKANSSQTFTMKGDTINYIPGSPYYQEFACTAGINQLYTLSHTAIAYSEGGSTLYALSVCAKNPTTHTSKRLFIGVDYTNTSTTVTTLADLNAAGYTKIGVVYGSAAAATYSLTANTPVVTNGVKPSAVRGRDICVYVSDGAATPTMVRWGGIQSVDVTWKVALQPDEELCNHKYLGQDYDTSDVTGTIVVKPVDSADLFSKIDQVMGVATNVVAGPYAAPALPVEIRINHPDTGATLKTIYIPDAKFTLPAVQGKINTKLATTFTIDSNSGSMFVYSGLR